jgi:HSP20 family protein
MRHIIKSFSEIMKLQSEMNRLFDALQEMDSHQATAEIGFPPPYDVMDTPEAILVEMDLPGVDAENLRVTVRGSLVTVDGEKSGPSRPGILAYHLMERDRGRFSRNLRVEGAFNSRLATAEYSSGVLTLRLPKVQNLRGSLVHVPITLKK